LPQAIGCALSLFAIKSRFRRHEAGGGFPTVSDDYLRSMLDLIEEGV